MHNPTVREGFLGQKMMVLPKSIKQRLRDNTITQFFYITDLGYYPNADHHFRARKKGATEYILIYCVEGQGWLRLKDDLEETEVLPNQFFIIPKKTGHAYGANSTNPWSIYWMHFDGTAAKSLYKRYASCGKKVVAIPFETGRISLFDRIFDIFHNNHKSPKIEYACLWGLNFISDFIYHDVVTSVNTHNHENLVDSIVDFLNQNLDKSYSSRDIAQHFNYSPSYIFNSFKKKTGYSLIHFFNLKKIQKACEYMNYTDLSVKEISFKVGYQDPLYFSRMFKKYMGISPKFYKKEMNN